MTSNNFRKYQQLLNDGYVDLGYFANTDTFIVAEASLRKLELNDNLAAFTSFAHCGRCVVLLTPRGELPKNRGHRQTTCDAFCFPPDQFWEHESCTGVSSNNIKNAIARGARQAGCILLELKNLVSIEQIIDGVRRGFKFSNAQEVCLLTKKLPLVFISSEDYKTGNYQNRIMDWIAKK